VLEELEIMLPKASDSESEDESEGESGGENNASYNNNDGNGQDKPITKKKTVAGKGGKKRGASNGAGAL